MYNPVCDICGNVATSQGESAIYPQVFTFCDECAAAQATPIWVFQTIANMTDNPMDLATAIQNNTSGLTPQVLAANVYWNGSYITITAWAAVYV